jgi:hypothetical protein
MRNLLVLIFCLPFFASAQRIAMVDIKGPTTVFVERMKKEKGFIQVGTNKGLPMLRGKIKNDSVTLILHETPINHRLYKVDVRFDAIPKWKKTKKFYLAKKEKLIEKYGPIKIDSFKFQEPFCDGGRKEWEAFSQNKATVMADWGEMQYFQNLHLQYYIHSDGHIYLSYTLRDEEFKYQEEKELSKNSIF